MKKLIGWLVVFSAVGALAYVFMDEDRKKKVLEMLGL